MKLKYELTDETKVIGNHKLHRIRALMDFWNVNKSDLGGFIEHETNLSHEGACWVSENARVFENAIVSGDARVYDNAEIYGNAEIHGNAQVFGNAYVSGNSLVFGNAIVSGDAYVAGDARVYDNAEIYGNAEIHGNAQVFGNALVFGNAYVSGNSLVFGNAIVSGDVWVYFGSFRSSALIKSNLDYLVFGNVGSEKGILTAYKTATDIHVNRGCFTGTLEEFNEAVEKKHGSNQYAKEYFQAIEMIKIRFGIDKEL